MNERIKQLAAQSGFLYDQTTGLIAGPNAHPYLFAELIIKDCAQFVDSKLEMTRYSNEVLGWADGEDILTHWGITK